MKRPVLIGSRWKRWDPNGTTFQDFEVISTSGHNPFGARVAKGRTVNGKTITCSLVMMESGDPRFELVHENYVSRRSA